MCSPLHIRAPTRPLILQCVTELYRDLVTPIPVSVVVVVTNSVGVNCCATSTDECADNRAFRSTRERAYQSSSAGAGCGRDLVSMLIPS